MQKVTLLRGDGIGPEVTSATMRAIEATGAKIEWEVMDAGITSYEACSELLPQKVLDSIRTNKVALKGPLTTPVGNGFRSINVSLRKEFNLYANVRPSKTFEGIVTKYSDIDLIVVRENTEDLYSGVEHMVGRDAAESIRIISREASEKIVRYAFELALKQNRKKVTALHKANIMKCTDGLFLSIAREVAKDYPQIEFDDIIIDAACMKLVTNPEKFDIIVTTNLFGDIVSDLCSGLIGGLGLTCGNNIGEDCAIFEAVHGSAPDIAGQNKANPTAVMMAGIEMLKYIGMNQEAEKLLNAIKLTFKNGINLTADLGGNAGTDTFTDELIKNMGVVVSEK